MIVAEVCSFSAKQYIQCIVKLLITYYTLFLAPCFTLAGC